MSAWMTGERRSATGSRQGAGRGSWQAVGPGHMMGRHVRHHAVHGAMGGWGHGQPGCMAPKGLTKGQRG